MSFFHRLEIDIPVLLEKSDVPGMSIALIRDGRVVWSKGFGVSNGVTKKPVTNKTIFEAASLSKPVFAYAVLRLVDEGKLNLDTPLNKYLGNNYDVVGDGRINLITPGATNRDRGQRERRGHERAGILASTVEETRRRDCRVHSKYRRPSQLVECLG